MQSFLAHKREFNFLKISLSSRDPYQYFWKPKQQKVQTSPGSIKIYKDIIFTDFVVSEFFLPFL